MIYLSKKYPNLSSNVIEFELSLTAWEMNQKSTKNILLNFHKTLQLGNS